MTLREREAIAAITRSDPRAKSLHIERCRRDFAYTCNTSFFIFEPREGPDWSVMPYLLRDFQEFAAQEVNSRIDSGRDILIDKTREMGVTWLILSIFVWRWLFEPRFTATVSSITEKKIDSKEDPNTLFWKIDFLIESTKYMYPELYPAGYSPKHRSHMKRFNPVTNSVLIGEVMGPNLGRSGRSKAMLLDEFAEAPYPQSSYASSSRTTPCRIFVFTPKGMNFAGRLANPKQGTKRSVDRITLHWTLDYTKNKWIGYDEQGNVVEEGHGPVSSSNPKIFRVRYPWYEEACTRLSNDPVLIAQELDCNYNESVEGLMYPQIERARFGKYEYNPDHALYLSMDYGLQDMTALVWWQFDPVEKRFKVIDYFQHNGKTIKWYVPLITGSDLGIGSAEGGYTEDQVEMAERHAVMNGRYTDFYGDPSGKQRNQVTATSVMTVLRDYGIYVRTNSKSNSYLARKFAFASILPYCDFNETRCSELIEAIRASRQKPDGTPIHGPESHGRTACEFFAVNQKYGLFGASESDYERLSRGIVSPDQKVSVDRETPPVLQTSDPMRYRRLIEKLTEQEKRLKQQHVGLKRTRRSGW